MVWLMQDVTIFLDDRKMVMNEGTEAAGPPSSPTSFSSYYPPSPPILILFHRLMMETGMKGVEGGRSGRGALEEDSEPGDQEEEGEKRGGSVPVPAPYFLL